MKIEISVTDLQLDSVIATEPTETYGHDGPEEGPARDVTLREAVVAQIAQQITGRNDMSEWRSAVTEAIKAEAERRAADIVDEAITTPYQPHDSLGLPRGEATTIRDEIVKSLHGWATSKVKDRYDGPRNIDAAISKVVDRKWVRELEREAERHKAAIQRAIEAEGGRVVAELATKLTRN